MLTQVDIQIFFVFSFSSTPDMEHINAKITYFSALRNINNYALEGRKMTSIDFQVYKICHILYLHFHFHSSKESLTNCIFRVRSPPIFSLIYTMCSFTQ